MKLLALLCLCATALADLPVDCRYSDIVGTWQIQETERNGTHRPDCDKLSLDAEFKHTKVIKLMYPNIVTDEFGNQGTWTMVYNQGFEVRVAGRSYFAFSFYEDKKSLCDRTFPGWSRVVSSAKNWACYVARKATHVDPRPINSSPSTGFTRTRFTLDTSLPKPQPSLATLAKARSLPRSWDWRNVSGINYVTPVKSQGQCGSCYAFASTAAIESQIMIRSNATEQFDLSPQDVIGCSKLAQGCDGGFAFLIAGRYGQEEGLVPEKCVPYKTDDTKCFDRTHCRKVYTTEYSYIGGYYGACNEAEMMVSLVEDGPLPVGIMVYDDLRHHYHGGVYQHTTDSLQFDPLTGVNHNVLLVGYGVTEEGEKYWIIKNSWEHDWGLHGYGWIRRGTDEIGIESTAVRVIAYP